MAARERTWTCHRIRPPSCFIGLIWAHMEIIINVALSVQTPQQLILLTCHSQPTKLARPAVHPFGSYPRSGLGQEQQTNNELRWVDVRHYCNQCSQCSVSISLSESLGRGEGGKRGKWLLRYYKAHLGIIAMEQRRMVARTTINYEMHRN